MTHTVSTTLSMVLEPMKRFLLKYCRPEVVRYGVVVVVVVVVVLLFFIHNLTKYITMKPSPMAQWLCHRLMVL